MRKCRFVIYRPHQNEVSVNVYLDVDRNEIMNPLDAAKHIGRTYHNITASSLKRLAHFMSYQEDDKPYLGVSLLGYPFFSVVWQGGAS